MRDSKGRQVLITFHFFDEDYEAVKTSNGIAIYRGCVDRGGVEILELENINLETTDDKEFEAEEQKMFKKLREFLKK